MKFALLPEAGTWYKANLHCHTTLSDGKMTPQEVKEHYKSHGYSAVCYTDHEVLAPHEDLCDETFIALHGYEVAIKKDPLHHTGNFMPVYHFNMIAERQDTRIMPRCFRDNPSYAGAARTWMEQLKPYDENDLIFETQYDKEWLNDYLSAVRDAGFLIAYNHPQWSLQTSADYLGLEGLHAVEAINGGCARMNDNTSLPFEQMLRSGMDVFPVGGDDNHSLSDCCLAWTMLKAEELTYDALISAYKNGNCYASEGPELLSLYIEDGEIVVQTSPAASIVLLSEGRRCCSKADPNGTCTEARFPYTPESFGRFFRIEVKDAQGHPAYSRAYFTKDIATEG